ncbi:MAG TPA: hypoxanthine phosphoribosyltransferase [Clostridiaceae bacterium]|nr:hypoxanthine phosphoribosyltransferase [Clostridiaceae bacterium]
MYISEILVSKEEIETICKRLGEQITADYQGKEIVLICILKGAIIFLADLMRKIEVPCEIDFMSVSSYTGTKSSGDVKIIKDLDDTIEDKHVILVEDIIDSGLTLSHLVDMLKSRNPASLRICACFDKPDRRRAEVKVDYIGRQIPDKFIVGYGLDYNGQYRNLPDICVLTKSDQEELDG